MNAWCKNCWRLSIKSALVDETDGKSYFLTKECRAELVGEKPFNRPDKHEMCVVVDNKRNTYKIRDIPVFKRNEFGAHFHEVNKDISDELLLKTTKYKKLDFSEVFTALKKRTLGDIYSKFSFTYQSKKYFIFTKVEYINFNGDLSREENDYLQPIFGYVPFLKNGKIHLGYIAKYIERDFDGKLQLILRVNKPFIYFVSYPKRLLKKIIYFLFKIYTYPIQVSEFSETITLENSKLDFFEVNTPS